MSRYSAEKLVPVPTLNRARALALARMAKFTGGQVGLVLHQDNTKQHAFSVHIHLQLT